MKRDPGVEGYTPPKGPKNVTPSRAPLAVLFPFHTVKESPGNGLWFPHVCRCREFLWDRRPSGRYQLPERASISLENRPPSKATLWLIHRGGGTAAENERRMFVGPFRSPAGRGAISLSRSHDTSDAQRGLDVERWSRSWMG